jgi:succinate dehydrogenase flavin-adding protein (antitoxin of CptAB toxin-antitoxin module)
MPLSDDQNKEFIAYLDSMDKSLYELLANIRFIKRILISVLLIPAIFSSFIALVYFLNN